jgi:hypothetical protein
MQPRGLGSSRSRKRRRRNPSNVDPIPWIIGGVIAWAAYELFVTITGGGSAPVQTQSMTAAQSAAAEAATGYGTVTGGGASF